MEYSRTGAVIKGQEKAVVKSRYEEDVLFNNHTVIIYTLCPYKLYFCGNCDFRIFLGILQIMIISNHKWQCHVI